MKSVGKEMNGIKLNFKQNREQLLEFIRERRRNE